MHKSHQPTLVWTIHIHIQFMVKGINFFRTFEIVNFWDLLLKISIHQNTSQNTTLC